MIFDNGYHQLYNDVNADTMFSYIRDWMEKTESKKNLVLWNSAKVSGLKTDLLKQKNYVKKFLLLMIGALIALIAITRRLRKYFKAY